MNETTDSLLFNPNDLLDMLMKGRGINHRQISRRLNVNYVTWINYRKNPGTMKLGFAKTVCDILDISLDELYKVLTEGRNDE